MMTLFSGKPLFRMTKKAQGSAQQHLNGKKTDVLLVARQRKCA